MATPVQELDLPEVDTFIGDREEALALLRDVQQKNWLARLPLGYAVTRYEDVVAILRDKRFHSAVAMLPQMSGVSDPSFLERRGKSILAMEGDEHSRLRRLVAPAFTPKSADRLRPFAADPTGTAETSRFLIRSVFHDPRWARPATGTRMFGRGRTVRIPNPPEPPSFGDGFRDRHRKRVVLPEPSES